ncbi:aminotransferase [Spiribacter halobius]|uniref:Aminotransferase n=2 Tax=Sediminicurvatus halobius TaxID=2182432 RepID=A0A2U2MYU5_9GAMM|nr:aminotransferase [Spiribacter halobius]
MREFPRSFTEQQPIPAAGIERATEVMASGKLHRYNLGPGETDDAALLEQEFAGYVGRRYCVACNSGGFALHIALRALLPERGTPVLCNAFTLSPVPGAIHNAGGVTVPVETDESLTIDCDDLRLAAETHDARFLVLTHMRGHIADMDAVAALCAELGITLIEDCAHTMGAYWRNRPSGAHGTAACFSTQSNKHINSGEGGLLVTDDAELAARAVLYTGSYMFYDSHLAAPPRARVGELSGEIPNYSGRMDRLRAALLRPQLSELEARREHWNALYRRLEGRLAQADGITLPQRHAAAEYVGSSLQFWAEGLALEQFPDFISRCADRGVPVAWFGNPSARGYTSNFRHWRYLSVERALPKTQNVLSRLCDIRLPLTFTEEDCALIGEIIDDSLQATRPE